MAHGFPGSQAIVLILESGGLKSDEHIQELNEGVVIRVTLMLGCDEPVVAKMSGTPHLWNTSVGDEIGAKYVPLDPCDFDELADFLTFSGRSITQD